MSFAGGMLSIRHVSVHICPISCARRSQLNGTCMQAYTLVVVNMKGIGRPAPPGTQQPSAEVEKLAAFWAVGAYKKLAK